jgi:hypothetical protein
MGTDMGEIREIVGEIKGRLDSQDRYCVSCKQNNQDEHDGFDGRIGDIEISRAKNAGVQEGKKEAIVESQTQRNWRLTFIVGAFGAGASLATIIAYWPQVKHFFGG